MMNDREIILNLFNPMSEHADGCLFKGNHNLPCQCGFVMVRANYKSALRHAKEIASKHYGSAWEGADDEE